jgi:NAD(P)-dependent dehydrogenase (short-subunit alcohol dehydrogenase family)
VIGDSSRVGESGLAIVAAARAGVVALMKSLAREFGRNGTTANTVSLGLVETDHDKEWVEANREKLVKFYPVRRLGQAGDVAPMSRCWCRKEWLDYWPDFKHQRRVQHGVREEDRCSKLN